MNPLVDTCLKISQAGYSLDPVVDGQYHNSDLLKLGTFLLNNSNLKIASGHVLYLHSSKEAQRPKTYDKEVAIAFGGGIDSYCAIWYALLEGFTVKLIHINYGQPYYYQERDVFKYLRRAALRDEKFSYSKAFFADFARVQNMVANGRISFFEQKQIFVPKGARGLDWENYIIPARNLVLAAIASNYARRVWIVATKRSNEEVGTPDKTSRFYHDSSKTFSEFYGQSVTVESPFFHLSKSDVVSHYLNSGGRVEALLDTFSCYSPVNNLHCGTCYACWKRYKLFASLGVKHEFVTHPLDGPNNMAFQAKEAAKGRE